MSDTADQKQFERETEGYKLFMRVATRMQKLEYGKWQIVPDSSDPLRKFTLNRDIGWATLKIQLFAKEFYHRGTWNDSRWDYKFQIGYGGLYSSKDGEVVLKSALKVRPRLAKDLIKQVNDVIIPKFYEEILAENKERMARQEQMKQFYIEIARVNGLQVGPKSWRGREGVLKNCPLALTLENSSVKIEGDLGYGELAIIAKAMGWGNP